MHNSSTLKCSAYLRKEKILGLDKKKFTAVGRSLTIFGFYCFGADSISEEVAGFSPLWFPRGKHCVHCLLCFDCCTCLFSQ